MPTLDELRERVHALQAGLQHMTYYEFLGVRPSSDYVAIRDAYYDRAQQLHPDRFVAYGAGSLQRTAYAVYKRISEAFSVLSDPQLRVAYDEARLRGAHRLDDVARARRRSPQERQLSNNFARIYYRAAVTKLDEGLLRAAWIDVQLGLSLEDAPVLRELENRIITHPDGPHALEEEVF
jgi:curved DNA-binding protein CbpA